MADTIIRIRPTEQGRLSQYSVNGCAWILYVGNLDDLRAELTRRYPYNAEIRTVGERTR